MSSRHCHLSVWTGLFAPQSVVAYFSSTPSEVPCDWEKREVPGQTKCGPSPTPLQGKPCWLQAQITEEGWMWDLYLCSVKVFQEAQTKRLQKQGKHRVASLFSLAGWCLWKCATSADTLTCNRSFASYKYWRTYFHEWPWRTLCTRFRFRCLISCEEVKPVLSETWLTIEVRRKCKARYGRSLGDESSKFPRHRLALSFILLSESLMVFFSCRGGSFIF